MKTDLKEIKAKFEDSEVCIITAHDRPDPDAMGSVMGIYNVLKNMGKTVYVVGCQPLPDSYLFMMTDAEISLLDKSMVSDKSAMIVLDCGNSDRAELVDKWKNYGGFIINIDHHKSNTMFGEMNYVDSDASSTSEIIVFLCRKYNWNIPQVAANSLYAGLLSDTGKFTFENTSQSSLEAGAFLVKAGAEPSFVGEHIYRSVTLESVHLSARAMASLKIKKGGKLSYVSLSATDYQETGCQPQDSGEIVDIAKNIKGACLSFFFYEMKAGNETKVSIRASEPINAIELASVFNGGGHPRAAGCSVNAGLADAKKIIFDEVDRLWGKLLERKD